MKQEIHREFLFAFSFLGLLVAGYLLSTRIRTVPLVCGVSNWCEVVTTSRYAYIFGIPVATYGVGYYLTMLILSLVLGRDTRVMPYMFGLSTAGFLFTGYLFYLQQYVIRAFCLWCISSAIIATLLFVISLLAYRAMVKRAYGGKTVQ